MPDASLAVQAAIIAALRGAPEVTSIVSNRIYDRPSPQAVKPYISLGPEDWQNTEGVGQLSHTGAVQIDVWSVMAGRTEGKRIANAVQDALHTKNLTLEAGSLVLLVHRLTRYFTEADGLTSHAAMDFRASTQGM
jgi:hypothetical protein